MSFHNETFVKRTRKACWCEWCGQSIAAGQSSVATAGIHEGDFYKARYHPECAAATKRWWETYGRNSHSGEWPDESMNRGGIEPKGEPETQPLDQPQTQEHP